MSNNIQIRNRLDISYPHPLLPATLEVGVIPLILSAQRVHRRERYAVSVDGEAVIIRNGNVLCAVAMLLAVIPILLIARTFAGFGVFKRTVEFLTGSSVIAGFAVAVYGESGFAQHVAARKLNGIFGIALDDRNVTLALINIFYGIVNILSVIAFID